ncbi:sensor histidine kinase [Insolitispirillum peregrinum]|uniref:histidine kinase n=1 Tax=Insolitispirillum peregrinum TaxID=80876 RepID=A0A1N7PBC8_9PROT|nr:sensor histidine kinase [Insolitispirillum peregrinum]SIT07912.1 Histidine kinase-, DNA gyrase B-, and HSP90-like ATPase [Insolitispirillum peregrinum]
MTAQDLVEPQSVQSPTPWWSRLVAGLFLLILGSALAAQLWLARAADLANAEQMVQSMAVAIAQNIGGSVRSVDSLLVDMAVSVAEGSWEDPANRLRFEGRLSAFPELLWVGVTGMDGMVSGYPVPAFSGAPWRASASHRDYFRVFAGGDPAGGNGGRLHVGLPAIGQITGERTIHLSRAILKDSKVIGIMVAAVSADYYAGQLGITLLDSDGASAVLRSDGLMMARAPAHAEKFGINISSSDLFTKWLPREKQGVVRLISKADGNDKLLSYQQLDRYPLVVTSGVSLQKALTTWNRMMVVEVTGFILFSGAVIYWASMSDLRNGAILRHRETLKQAVAEQTADLERAKSLAERRAEDITSLNLKLSRLAQVTAHDLQEPVRRMVSFSQLLRRRLHQLSEEAEADLRYIEDGGKRLKMTLEGFRQYTELLGGTPVFEGVPLRDCVELALEPLREAIAAGGGEVRIGSLPSVPADRSFLTLAIARLIDNAWRYRDTERPARITISGGQDDTGWWLAIEDNGQGLPTVMDQWILNPVAVSQGPGERSGMGLAFCQAVAEIHGGHLEAERLPEGTRFILRGHFPDIS